MKASRKTAVCLLALAVALAGCVVSGPGQLTIAGACTNGALNPAFTQPGNVWSVTWQGIAFLAASTVWVVSILVYVIGFGLHHEKAVIWAKEQMQEAVLAMVITIFVVGFVSFLCTIDLSSLGMGGACLGTTYNLVDAAFCALQSVYLSIMQGLLLVLGLNAAMGAASTISVGFAPGGIGAVFSPYAFLGDIANSLLLATIALMTGAVLTLTQMVLVKMTAALFVILFPIGIILRSFGATRGFGGGLIAIALGFFLMYPLLVILFYGSVGGNVGISGEISNDYSNLGDSFQTAGPSPTDPSWFGGILSPFIGFIGKAIMGAIFVPLLMFMVLIAFVKGLSMALGEEVDVSNLTRLI